MSFIDVSMFRTSFGMNLVLDQVDYDANSNAIYLGYRPAGFKTSDAVWLIYKNTYDGSNRYISSAVAAPFYTSIWDNRSALNYV